MSEKMTKTSKNGLTTSFEVPDDYDLGIERDDVKIPSVILWQKISDLPEFEDEDVKAGEFVNPVTIDKYGDSFECAIIKYYVTARIFGEVDQKTGRKEVLKYSKDAKHWEDGSIIQPSEFQWTDDGSHALKSYHYLVLVKGNEIPAILTFKGASAKYAKGLNANLMYTRPSWRSWFKVSSRVEESGGNKYYVIQAKAQPKRIVDQDTANACVGYYKSLSSVTVTSSDMDKTLGEVEEPTLPF